MSQPHRVLLVEDDREQAMLFAQVLKLAGYEVVTTVTAEEALEKLATARFALLLADWDLPGVKGDTLITSVKTTYPTMKSVLYSNHHNVNDVCHVCGADAWFRKTDSITSLRRIITELLPRNGNRPS
jgi:two-component system phosphate regulon response regulator PhoB